MNLSNPETKAKIAADSEAIRQLFRAEGRTLKKQDVLEAVTGIRDLTYEQRQRLAICEQALVNLAFASSELELNWDNELIYRVNPAGEDLDKS